MTTTSAAPETTAPTRPERRLVGVDLARGLAVLGMFVAHVYATGAPHWDQPSSWIGIAYGPSSILSAVLAGVSTGLLTGRDHPPQGTDLPRARLSLLTRAALLLLLGGLTQLLVVNVANILEQYAVLLALCVPLLTWRPRRLLVLAAVLLVAVNPLFRQVLEPWVANGTYGGGALGGLAVTGVYPVIVWSAFVVAGLALGRSDLTSARARLRALGAGAVAAVLGYVVMPAIGAALGSAGYAYQQSPAFDPDHVPFAFPWQSYAPPVRNLFWPEPHSGTPAEVLGSGGLVVAVLAVLLLVGDRLRIPLFPLAALGNMPLTAYCAQLVALAVVGCTMTRPDGGLVPLLWFIGTALAAATAWSLTLGRGPLERLVGSICRRTTAPGGVSPAARRSAR